MLSQAIKSLVIIAIASLSLNGTNYDKQAEKDRIALEKYTVDKFKDPVKNRDLHFPYSTDHELKKIYNKNIPAKDFSLGLYAYNPAQKDQRDQMLELPPFEENIEKGEVIYNKYFKTCIPDPAIVGDYPMFDEKMGKVITLSGKIMQCAKEAGLKEGKKDWNMKQGIMTDLQAYLAYESTEAGKKVNTQINSIEAALAYEDGKKEFYKQRGYLKLSCATCHVQGAGKRVRVDYMSPVLGAVTHFPVYRIGKSQMYTLEGRLGGCNRNMGEKPHKAGSTWSNNILYFMAYMSKGMKLDGPDIRK